MPNVKGLDPAPVLVLTLGQGASTAYGPHCKVRLDGSIITLLTLNGDAILTVDMAPSKPKIKANLARIDGDTVTAVNAVVRPFGKVKQYWRTEEYRWHPLGGKASPVQGKHAAPVATLAVPVTAPVVTPSAPSVTPSTPVVSVMHPATAPVIETMVRWQDRRRKQPVQRAVTKTYSSVDEVMVPTRFVARLDSMKKRRDAGLPAFGLITGPAGTAKTALAQAWAFVNDLPVVIVEGQSIQTAGDWFGQIIPVGGGFEWVWSDAALLLMTGEPCLIVLDELNRPENERALNGIMGLTDWKAVVKPNGAPHAIRLAPGQCLIATLNEGPEFVGTVEVDAAVRSRFDAAGIRMDYTVEPIETRVLMAAAPGLDKVVAQKLVRVAASQRAKRDDDTLFPSHNVISTRALVTIAQAIAISGDDPVDAIWSTLTTMFTAEDEDALGVLIESQFGANAEPTNDLADDDEIDQMMAAQGF